MQRLMGPGIAGLSLGPARLLVGPLLAVGLLAASANAQPACEDVRGPSTVASGYYCIEVQDDLVSIRSQNVPVQRLLDEIARRSALLVISDAPLTSVVSLQCEQLELHKVVHRLVRDQNYLLIQTRGSAEAMSARRRSRSTLWILSGRETNDGQPGRIAKGEASIDDAEIRMLRSQLMSDDLRAKKNAIKVLGRIEADEAIPALAYALTDDNKEIRFRAIQALGSFDTDDVATTLAIAANDGHAGVRAEAAHWLGALGGETAISILEHTLHDPDGDVRETAIKAFASIGGEESAEALAVALHDVDALLRVQAIETLVGIGGEKVVRRLEEALADPDEDVRQAAADGLSELLEHDRS